MTRHTRVLTAILSVSVMGCLPKAPAINVMSGDFDLLPLVGQWRGTYSSTETGRTGTISFTLRAGETSAFGQVIMLPQTVDTVAVANSSLTTAAAVSGAPARQALTINFVRKEGGKLLGTLDPYTDPDCRCTVNTSFQGSFSDAATIEGTFTTVGAQPGLTPRGGSWKVTRVKRL